MVTSNATFSLERDCIDTLNEFKEMLFMSKSKLITAAVKLLKRNYETLLDNNQDRALDDIQIQFVKYLRRQL